MAYSVYDLARFVEHQKQGASFRAYAAKLRESGDIAQALTMEGFAAEHYRNCRLSMAIETPEPKPIQKRGWRR